VARTRFVSLAFVLATILASGAAGQVSFNVTYSDGANVGFNDNTIDSGETLTRGQLRRSTINAVTSYMSTVFDGRGTVDLNWGPSDSTPGGFLASFGPDGFVGFAGSFQNGQAYQTLRTNNAVFAGPDASGTFDFTYQYNYFGANTTSGSRYDMFTVALHEFTHGMGFINATNQLGEGLNGQNQGGNQAGTTDIYSTYDMFLQRGNGVGGQQFNTNLASSGYGSFVGDATTFTNNNNTTTGLFFGGQYAREVFAAAVPLFAPSTYQPGSSIGHTSVSPAGVMNPSIGTGVEIRAYSSLEIAMLMDLGYNVYNWNPGTTSTWTGGNVNNLAASPWRTNRGIVWDGSTLYNVNSSPGQAPILAPYGQVTSNVVLNFNGSSAYTSTNDIGTMRMSRINLNSTAGSASAVNGGTLLFGQNSDGTFSVLTPKIVQQNSGAFNFGSNVQIADPNRGLTLDGPGTGTVTFNGNLTGAGGLTKDGSFTAVLNGSANSYAGATVVNQGTLSINGNKTGTGTVTVNNGGRLQGSGAIAGAASVTAGGLLAPGNSAGSMTFTGGLTMNAGTYVWELATLATSGPGTNFDQIVLNGGASTLGGTSQVLLDFGLLGAGLDPNGSNSFWQSARQWQIVSVVFGSLNGNFAGLVNPNWNAGAFSLIGSAGGVILNFSPVPEPSTFVLLAAASGLVLVFRRRMGAKAGAPEA
jgi:autotransporter-associated beta strand protein